MRSRERNPITRRHALRKEIALRGAVSVAELSSLLNASPATIRRDLKALDEEGVLSKGYGGASIRPLRPAEEALAVRQRKFVSEKQAIAKAAVGLIKSGDTVFLNDGSTILELAREIALTDLEIFIATPAVNIAEILAKNSNITVCLLGGLLRQTSLATGGHFAISIVNQINADLAFLSCDAFSLTDGMCFTHPDDAAVAARMSVKATRTIGLVHIAKIDWKARISSVPVDAIDTLITEAQHPELESRLLQANVEMIVAGFKAE
ncbi:transcriptional regulator, DeoR family [Hoeflea sp. IMCC20628]|uniref:DeoR/GlpR family DNA-binding transcription regulator n=1 Tax=Hoeflea sp. IMCC20628 TaxID=1620421 RepID=UPI00063AC93D|nr:DeoR/GlpR family DNA-binding transcription regulator [Hoeflea sp. IMCC20628]AKI00534.1 transcriptional regulator, DeoR family [Hoeflea sp. IMCC20628]